MTVKKGTIFFTDFGNKDLYWYFFRVTEVGRSYVRLQEVSHYCDYLWEDERASECSIEYNGSDTFFLTPALKESEFIKNQERKGDRFPLHIENGVPYIEMNGNHLHVYRPYEDKDQGFVSLHEPD